jgi:prevent-host-death family protein
MTIRKAPRKPVSLLFLGDREVGAGEFKARCLEIMDEVQRLGVSVTVTKHRKPIVKIVPAADEAGELYGCMKGVVLQEGDLISPIDVEWEVDASSTA